MDGMTEKILANFKALSAIPRCSKQEKQFCRWLIQWANKHRLEIKSDSYGNLRMLVPSSPGFEDVPVVAIQGHVDMVCEKTPESNHDFSKDPIVIQREGPWLHALGTTLGADNGIAIAYAMALVEVANVQHPPLELLFTVDEESGLLGAQHLGDEMLSAGIMINLDSETEGVFTIGCAGGLNTTITLPLQFSAIDEAWTCFGLSIGGLRGGHSGVDIDKQRANANKLLAHIIQRMSQRAPLRMIHLKGGSRHNALAREASALLASPSEAVGLMTTLASELETEFKQAYSQCDPHLFLTVAPSDVRPADGPTREDTERLVNLMLALPHGVMKMMDGNPAIVETSCNLATMQIEGHQCTILTSQRSALASGLAEATSAVHAAAEQVGAIAINDNGYPPWPPKSGSDLVALTSTVYQALFSEKPNIQVIHAGLECAIIGERYPGLEMISFGPTIENPHSPYERLYIPSVEKVWRLLTTLLGRMR